MMMPFGRFKGLRLSVLPDDYLRWLCGIDLREPLKSGVEAEAKRRGLHRTREQSSRTHNGPPPPTPEVIAEIVGAARRALARVHHPDVGGDAAKMRDINSGCDWLLHELVARGRAA